MSDGTDEQWITKWLDAVQNGTASMSQRSRSSIDAHGGIDAVITAAKERSVHLVELTDDTGKALVAASRHAFTTLC